MAEGKKSVLLYCDIIHTVEKLDDETAGKLFKHYLRYVNDLNPKSESQIVDIVFEPIKQQLKRDLEKWENKKQDRSENGRIGNLKRYNPDLYEKYLGLKLTLEEAESIAKSRKTSLSDNSDRQASLSIANVAVTDNVTVTVKDIVIKDNSTLSADADDKADDLKIDFEALKNFWNEKAKKVDIPEIKLMSDTRKRKVKIIINNYGKQKLFDAINNLFASSFCLGSNANNWKADFDFVLQAKSFVKLIEGSYGSVKDDKVTKKYISYEDLKN